MPGWVNPGQMLIWGMAAPVLFWAYLAWGIPMIQISDAAYGVRASAQNGRYSSTALPSNIASAASWDTQAACDYGSLIGRELRAQGYNMTLGGGVNADARNRGTAARSNTWVRILSLPGNPGWKSDESASRRSTFLGRHQTFWALNEPGNRGAREVNAAISKRAMRENGSVRISSGDRQSLNPRPSCAPTTR